MSKSKIWEDFAIAIPTYLRNRELLDVLTSIESQSISPGLVMIMDNSRGLLAKKIIEEAKKKSSLSIEYIGLGNNYGPAGSFSFSVERLIKDFPSINWMMCRGDDNPFSESNALEEMHAFCNEVAHLKPVGIGTHGERFDWTISRSRRPSVQEISNSTVVDVDCIPGLGSPTYHLPSLEVLGINFDKDLFFGWEELDLGLRLRKKNQRLLISGSLDLKLRERLGVMNLPLGAAINPNNRNWRIYFHVRNYTYISVKHRHIKWIIRNILWVFRTSLGAIVKRKSFSEARARLRGGVDGLLMRAAPDPTYVPSLPEQVAVQKDV